MLKKHCHLAIVCRKFIPSSYVQVELTVCYSLLSADATAGQGGSWIENRWQSSRVRDDHISIAIRSLRRASDYLGELLVGREARFGGLNGKNTRSIDTLVGVDADDLLAAEALAHDDVLTIAVNWVGLVATRIVAVLFDGPRANLVELLDVLVKVAVSVVSSRPERFTVAWSARSRELVLLTLVNNRNTILQHSEGDGVLDPSLVRGFAGEAWVV